MAATGAGTFPVFGPKTYISGSPSSGPVADVFSANSGAAYSVRIFDLDGAAATVFLNGTPIIQPRDFRGRAAVISRSVKLLARNQLLVDVAGDPGSGFNLEVFGIDHQGPQINLSLSPKPNAAGWNNTTATVAFICSDDLDLVSCPAPVSVIREGANQTISGTAIDQAGNTARETIVVNVDKTPPEIDAIVTPAANPAGWNNSSATVTFTCADQLSGVASCPPPVNVISEGTTTITGVSLDRAGNMSPVLLAVKMDGTPPAIQAASMPAPNAAGWNNSDVTVSYTCSDKGSGIDLCPPARTVTTEGANQSIGGTARDRAGNASVATIAINVDKTPPRVTVASPANASTVITANLAVSGTATDLLSGLASVTCQGAAATISGKNFTCMVPVSQGANTISIQAWDNAGNTTEMTLLVQGGTPAIVSVSPSAGQPGQQNLPVTITGQYTHFATGVTAVNFGQGASVISVTVNSPTSLSVVLNLDWATGEGTRDVTVQSNAEALTAAEGFVIQSHASQAPGSISVRTYARCDGSSDDTVGLQSAIQAAVAANQTLQVDAPSPCVSGTLNVPSGLILTGPGTIRQKAGTGSNPLLNITGTSISISGVTFDGGHVGQSGANLLVAYNASEFFFEDNTLINTVSGQYALRLISTTKARIAGNQLSGIAGPGIAVTEGCSYVMVSANQIDHTAATSGLGGKSAYTAQTGSASGIHDVIFSGNTAIESVHFCFEAGNFFHGSTDVAAVYNILFANNTCSISNSTGINDCSAVSSPAACGGYSFSTMSNSSITGNSYDAAGQVVFIAAIEMTECSGCNATGNTLTGDTSTVFLQGSEGITVNCSGCVVSNNQITNWSPTLFRGGIEIHTIADPAFQVVDDNVVTGNRIVMPAGSNTSKGIYVNCNNHGGPAPSASRTVITGNTVTGAGPGNGQAIALMQNDGACTLDHSVIRDNTLSDASYGVQIYGGTNYTLLNNQISSVLVPTAIAGGATILSNRTTTVGRGYQPQFAQTGRPLAPRTMSESGGAPTGNRASRAEMLRPESWVSATGKGAKCDGITDDTLALQKAIIDAARNSNALRIDGASPCMSGPLTVSGPLRMSGPGVLRQIRGQAGNFLTITGNQIEVIGITFDGNLAGERGSILVYASDATQLVFQNNILLNTADGQYAFRGINLSDSLLSDNSVYSIRGTGIAIDDGSHGVRVEGNRIDHTAAAGGSLAGSAFSAEITGTSGAAISDIHFVGNIALESVHYCMESGNRLTGSAETSLASYITFESNHCTILKPGRAGDCATAAGPAACGGYFMAGQQNSSMFGNWFNAAGQDIVVAAVEVTACRACIVYGNILQRGSAGTPYPQTTAISANCTECLISNNHAYGDQNDIRASGIYIHTTPQMLTGADTIVTGNTVELPTNDRPAIFIACDDAGGGIERLVVVNNTITGSDSRMAVAARRPQTACVLDSIVLGGNSIRGAQFGYVSSDSLNTIYGNTAFEGATTRFEDDGGNSHLSIYP